MSDTFPVTAGYYQQFDADYRLDHPGEGYGGWRLATIDLSRSHTALVVMHAWANATYETYPAGWHAVEYIPRSIRIMEEIFPPLLTAVRGSGVRVYHVVAQGANYFKSCPGYQQTLAITPDTEPPVGVESDPTLEKLSAFHSDHGFPGKHNRPQIREHFESGIDFGPNSRPVGDEPVCEDAEQLTAVCRRDGVNHLVYVGFAINWCLLKSPGGMVDMSRRGAMCSTIRQAVTAVENKETCRDELCKQIALWRVALAFGYVFDLDTFIAAVRAQA